MRYIYTILLYSSLSTCNQNNTTSTPPKTDSVSIKIDSSISKTVSVDSGTFWLKDDTSLFILSDKILHSLKTKNYTTLAASIHPGWKVRFSPYGHIDTLHDQTLDAEKLLLLEKNQQKIFWGNYDGSGDSIKLSLKEYFKKFVYDVDFLNAKQKASNNFITNGGSFSNIKSIYPTAGFTHYYFSAINPKYNGMDWKGLVLIFKKENGKIWLIGVVHDQWRV